MNFDTPKYLQRIMYSDSLEPNLNTLKSLQKAHLLHIPFENLDIHNHVSIELSVDRIFDKIVYQNRGGFCYELNGLFYELLLDLGFHAIRVSARVYDSNNGYGKEYDHLAIIVTIGNTSYLTDVGFGEFTFEPLKLQLEVIQNDQRGNYVIDQYTDGYLRVNKMEDGEKNPEYIFKTEESALAEFRDMCNYHQTSPDSHFTRKRLITLPTENGRITISGNTLKIKELQKTTEIQLNNEAEFKKELWDRFKVKI